MLVRPTTYGESTTHADERLWGSALGGEGGWDYVVPDPSVEWFVRLGVPAAAILMPLGFFLSVASPQATRPSGLIALVYAGALVRAIAVFLLGVFLTRAGLS